MDYTTIKEEVQKIITGDVSTDDADLEKHARDTSLFYVKPSLVVYPKGEADLEALVKYVSEKKKNGADISLAMRSAGTCMAGGSLTTSIVVDTLRYMNHITEVSDVSATAEPGVLYRDFEKETLAKGWLMPSYPASREIAAIGGIVSNNAGGEKTLTYGKTAQYLEKVSIVYANGDKDSLSALSGEALAEKVKEEGESGRIHRDMLALLRDNYDVIQSAKPSVSKNSSGYYLWDAYDKATDTLDLSKVIVGSQGTLAVVSSATLNGVVPKKYTRMLVMFLSSTLHLGEIVPEILKHKPEALESYDDHTFKVAMKFFGEIARKMGGNMITLGFQFLPEFWMALTGGVPKIILLAEFTGDTEEEVNTAIDTAYEDMKRFGLTMKKTHHESQARKYWTFRRESFALLRSRMKGFRTAPTIDDICVHPKDLPTFLPEIDTIFSKYPDLIYTVAGHMGDGNFHIIPLVDIHQKGIVDQLHKLTDEVYDLVVKYKGSLSAEHNDGLIRTPYLDKMFSPEIITLFEKTKQIFDPLNILNPGKKVHGDKDYTWSHVDNK